MEETQGDETDLGKVLMKLGRTADGLRADGKSAAWKLALAAALKARTTATNRWLGAALQLGNLHAVSRKVAAWTRAPDIVLSKKLALTPNPQTLLNPFSFCGHDLHTPRRLRRTSRVNTRPIGSRQLRAT